MSSRLLVVGCLAVGSLAVAACAGEPPPPPPAPAQPRREAKPPPEMESEIGGMNEEAVGRAFDALGEPIGACVAEGAKRVRELGGRFSISMRIDREGRVRWVYLADSTLGDRETERCILGKVREAAWPQPRGGEGLATRAFDIEPGAAPVVWEEKKIRKLVQKAAESFAKCKKGLGGGYVATAYVRRDGRVAAAGIATPDADREDEADCLAKAVGKLRFGSPGRRAAKVTFPVP